MNIKKLIQIFILGFIVATTTPLISACSDSNTGAPQTVVVNGTKYDVTVQNGVQMVHKDGKWIPRWLVDQPYRKKAEWITAIVSHSAKRLPGAEDDYIVLQFPDGKSYRISKTYLAEHFEEYFGALLGTVPESALNQWDHMSKAEKQAVTKKILQRMETVVRKAANQDF